MKKFWVLLALLFIANGFCWASEGNKTESEKVFKLEEVVVTATKTPHMLKDVPVETVVITKEEIEESSAQTISDLLRFTPDYVVGN